MKKAIVIITTICTILGGIIGSVLWIINDRAAHYQPPCDLPPMFCPVYTSPPTPLLVTILAILFSMIVGLIVGIIISIIYYFIKRKKQ